MTELFKTRLSTYLCSLEPAAINPTSVAARTIKDTLLSNDTHIHANVCLLCAFDPAVDYHCLNHPEHDLPTARLAVYRSIFSTGSCGLPVTPHSVHINPTLDFWGRRSWRGKPVLSTTNEIGVVVTVAPTQLSSHTSSVYVRLLGTIAEVPSSGPPAMNDISTCVIWSLPVATTAVAAYMSSTSSWPTCLKWRNFFASNFLNPLMSSSVSEVSLVPEIPESAVKRRKTDSELSTTNRVVSALNDRYVPKLDAVSASQPAHSVPPTRHRSTADKDSAKARIARLRSMPRTKKHRP